LGNFWRLTSGALSRPSIIHSGWGLQSNETVSLQGCVKNPPRAG
jgi:hypothetical protein